MDAKTQQMQAELIRFEKTALYKHLVEESERRFRDRLARLIDLALMSGDQNVRRIAQAVRQDAVLWGDLARIRSVEDLPTGTMPKPLGGHFRDYTTPDFIEVGDPAGVGV